MQLLQPISAQVMPMLAHGALAVKPSTALSHALGSKAPIPEFRHPGDCYISSGDDEGGGSSPRLLRLVVDNSGSGPTESSNPYMGMRYYQIIQRLAEKGDPQRQIPLIHFLVKSLRRGLYPETPLSEPEENRIAAKIKRQQIRLGMIGEAVVADFLRDYDDNEGWS